MTAAPIAEAINRLDDGIPLPGDVALADQHDAWCQQGQPIPCVICGGDQDGPQGSECTSCMAEWDRWIAWNADV